jgi:hypothetical protein
MRCRGEQVAKNDIRIQGTVKPGHRALQAMLAGTACDTWRGTGTGSGVTAATLADRVST